MSQSALVLIAEGSEEIEAVVVIDVLRRAQISVDVAYIGPDSCVKCSRDVKIQADISLTNAAGNQYDLLVLPGGLGGAKTFASNADVGELIKKQEKEDRFIGAICAAPALVFPSHGIAKGKKITCYPSFSEDLNKNADYTFLNEKVVIDGKFITSQGPGTVFDFSLALVKVMKGEDISKKTAAAMLL